jgi:hypothetical protein
VAEQSEDSYDAGDEKIVAKAKSKRKRKQEADDHFLTTVLASYEGRAVIWRLISECGVFSSSFTGDVSTYFYEGKRSIGLDIISMIEAVDPHSMAKIRDEAVQREIDGK